MATELFDFEGPKGYRLSGRLELPDLALRGWAIFAHCFSCGKDSLATARITRALAANGIGVLRFDFAGLGTSQGKFAEAGFMSDVEDLLSAAGAMSAAGQAVNLLVGHSLGGAAVLMASSDIASVQAVATIGAPFDVAHVLHHFAPESLLEIEASGKAEVNLAGRTFEVHRSFIEDLRRHDMGARIATLRRPLLVMHAPLDGTVGIDNAGHIFGSAKHPKSFICLDGADHLMSRREDADYAAGMIAVWASRYLTL